MDWQVTLTGRFPGVTDEALQAAAAAVNGGAELPASASETQLLFQIRTEGPVDVGILAMDVLRQLFRPSPGYDDFYFDHAVISPPIGGTWSASANEASEPEN